jgi:hypothetical protein
MRGGGDRGGTFKKGGGAFSGMSSAKVLSTDLKNAISLADVLNAVEKARAAAQPLGFIAAATAVYKLGKFKSALTSPGVKWILSELERLAPDINAQGVSNTALSLAKMRASPTISLWHALTQRSLKLNSREFQPQAIANLMWGLATAGVPPGDALVFAMSAEAVSKAQAFNTQNIANLMLSLAKLHVSPSAELVQAMSAAAVSKAEDFEAQHISNLMWAHAKLRISPTTSWCRRCHQQQCQRPGNLSRRRSAI